MNVTQVAMFLRKDNPVFFPAKFEMDRGHTE